MASNYGPHFGVRRWDEDMATREGRLKTPASGSKLLIGTAVEQNFAAAGFMKQAVADRKIEPGVAGLLIYEDQFLSRMSIDTPGRFSTADLAYADLGRYAVLTTGAGCKFWFKNVAAYTGPDNHVTPAITPVVGLGAAGIALGDLLGWNGTQWEKVDPATEADLAWFRVVSVNDAAASCEATLLR